MISMPQSRSGRRRSKEGVNKAELIRKAFKALGTDASAKAVQEHVGKASSGIDVAPAQISNIRTKLLKKKAGGKAKRRSGEVNVEELVLARSMAEKIGGVERAKELLDILHRLRPSVN